MLWDCVYKDMPFLNVFVYVHMYLTSDGQFVKAIFSPPSHSYFFVYMCSTPIIIWDKGHLICDCDFFRSGREEI